LAIWALLLFYFPLTIITRTNQPAHAQIQNRKERREEATLLIKLGIEQYNNKQNQEAINTLQKALVIAQELEARSEMPIILEMLGNTYIQLGQANKGIDFLQQALILYRELAEKGKQEILYRIFPREGRENKAQALEFISKAENIRKKLQSEAIKYVSRGIAMHDRGQFLAALEFYQKALTIYQQIKDASGESKTLYKMGLTSFYLKDYQRAIRHVRNMISVQKNGRKYN
jgi:tetratricopeptide (TPR) repeat protein